MVGKSLILIPFTVVVRYDENCSHNGEMVSTALDEGKAQFVEVIESVGDSLFYLCKSKYNSPVWETIFSIWEGLPGVVDVLSVVPIDEGKATLTGWYASEVIEESDNED